MSKLPYKLLLQIKKEKNREKFAQIEGRKKVYQDISNLRFSEEALDRFMRKISK